MTVRKRRGQWRDGLFWQPGQHQQPAEAHDNPRLRQCPHPPCRALPGDPCTVHRRGRRTPMRDYHPARKEEPTP